jgi:hypothetical protein
MPLLMYAALVLAMLLACAAAAGKQLTFRLQFVCDYFSCW